MSATIKRVSQPGNSGMLLGDSPKTSMKEQKVKMVDENSNDENHVPSVTVGE